MHDGDLVICGAVLTKTAISTLKINDVVLLVGNEKRLWGVGRFAGFASDLDTRYYESPIYNQNYIRLSEVKLTGGIKYPRLLATRSPGTPPLPDVIDWSLVTGPVRGQEVIRFASISKSSESDRVWAAIYSAALEWYMNA
jgi:hypothetical protein